MAGTTLRPLFLLHKPVREEDTVENHMEEEEDRSHGEQEATVGDTGGRVCPTKVKWVQGETQMQWMWTKEREETEPTMCAGSGTIWPKIVGIGRKRGE